MHYPEWAPKSLVELHKIKINSEPKGGDAESITAAILKKHGSTISDEHAENIRRRLYRTIDIGGFPEHESIALLEKLITDQNMKTVWASLSKRFKDQQAGPYSFFFACQVAIARWRGEPKQTPAERKVFYQELYDTAGKLSYLMHRASGFDHYAIDELIKDQSIVWLIETLKIPPLSSPDPEQVVADVQYFLSEIVPSFGQVLSDIAEKAKSCRDESVTLKKPNSQNAGVHYFIRALSKHCQQAYGQPLHEVVAVTTSVVFDLPSCDEDYVRKIVRA